MSVEHSTEFAQFLVRQFQKFIQQSKFVHDFQCRGMNRVAAKIAKEVSVFFQNDHVDTCTREQITGHHSRRPATHDHATSLGCIHRFQQTKNSFSENRQRKICVN